MTEEDFAQAQLAAMLGSAPAALVRPPPPPVERGQTEDEDEVITSLVTNYKATLEEPRVNKVALVLGGIDVPSTDVQISVDTSNLDW